MSAARHWRLAFLAMAFVMAITPLAIAAPSDPPVSDEALARFDTTTGHWHFENPGGEVVTFKYGAPSDIPLLGDWDCNGTATIAVVEAKSGRVHIRNTNSAGDPDLSFYFGIPGDVMLVGDWNGDGCDTIAAYRPTRGLVFLTNSLGTRPADRSFYFGMPGDRPFAGDFDGDGTDSVGLKRGDRYFLRNSLSTGIADIEFQLGWLSDLPVIGDWNDDGIDTVAVLRPSEQRLYVPSTNSQPIAETTLDIDGAGNVVSGSGAAPLASTTTSAPGQTTSTIAPTTTTTTTAPSTTTTTTQPTTSTSTTTPTTTAPPTTTTTAPPPPTTTTVIPTTTTTLSAPPGAGPVVDVTSYGANGSDSADDTSAVEAAVAALPNNATLFFPAGTYHLSRTIRIFGKNGVAVAGAGQGATTVKATGSHASYGLLIQNSQNITAQNLTIDMNKGATADRGDHGNQMAVYIITTQGSMANITLEDMAITNVHRRGVVIKNRGGGTMNGLVINRTTIANTDGIGIYADSMQGLTVSNSVLDTVGMDTTEGIWVGAGSSNVTIHNNALNNVGWHAIATSYLSGLTISDNTITNPASTITGRLGYGIAVSAGTTGGVVVTGNTVSNSKAGGIAIDVAIDTPEYRLFDVGMTLTDNFVTDSRAGHALYLNHVEGGLVAGNTTRNTLDGSAIALNDSRGITIDRHTSTNDRSHITEGNSGDVPTGGHSISGFVAT